MAMLLPPPEPLVEAELKIPVAGRAALDALEARVLEELGWSAVSRTEETDVYYEGPAVRPGSALRLRHSQGAGREAALSFTFKGPLLDGPGKSRAEIDVPVCGGYHGSAAALLVSLGLKPGPAVRKARRQFRASLRRDILLDRCGPASGRDVPVAVCLDEVEDAGCYVELEAVVPASLVTDALEGLSGLARRLGLDPARNERRGYAELAALARAAVGPKAAL